MKRVAVRELGWIIALIQMRDTGEQNRTKTNAISLHGRDLLDRIGRTVKKEEDKRQKADKEEEESRRQKQSIIFVCWYVPEISDCVFFFFFYSCRSQIGLRLLMLFCFLNFFRFCFFRVLFPRVSDAFLFSLPGEILTECGEWGPFLMACNDQKRIRFLLLSALHSVRMICISAFLELRWIDPFLYLHASSEMPRI
jgi:hypothetical protein